MNKGLIVLTCFIVLACTAGFFILSPFTKNTPFKLPGSATGDMKEWTFQKTITEPLKAVSKSGSDTTLGDIAVNKVTLVIGKKTFDDDTQILLSNPDTVPAFKPGEMETAGAPIEIKAGTKTRLNEKASITFAFDKGKLPSDTKPYQMRVAYYNGSSWDYIKPVTVDLDKGLMTFETFHFSLFGASRTNDKTLADAWTRQQAVANKMKSDITSLPDVITSKQIDLALEKMNVKDPAVKEKILSGVLRGKDYESLRAEYNKGNETSFNDAINMLIGTEAAKNIPEKALVFAFNKIEAVKDTKEAADAAANAAEGNYKEAAKIIGENITDKFLLGKAAILATKAVNFTISAWKNTEVEAAYKAYRDGANGIFYGYNTEKGDFNAVWTQMRGLGRQLQIEAIAKENEAREEAGLPELTDEQMDKIRNEVKISLQKQFETRSKLEDSLSTEEKKLKLIVGAFDKAGFLGVAPPAGLDKGFDIENKLDVLNHFTEKMMKDTGRFDVSEKTGLLVNGKISLDDLVAAARAYFSGPTGKDAYAKFLQDRYGITPYPPLTELAGTWKGSMTVTSVFIDPAYKNNKQAQKDDGCDLDLDFEKMIGKSNPITVVLHPESDSGGTLEFTGDSDSKSIPFTYKDGTVKAVYTEKGAVATFNLPFAGDDKNISSKGGVDINFKDKVRIKAAVALGK